MNEILKTCEYCGKKYLLDFRIPGYWRNNNISRFCSKECQVSFCKDFLINSSKERRKKNWVCKKCGNNFETERLLEKHKKICNPLKHYDWPCKYCGQVLPSRRKLSAHIHEIHPEIHTKGLGIKKKKLLPGETHHCKWCGADLGTNKKKGWIEHRDNCEIYKSHLNSNGVFVYHWSDEERKEISERLKEFYLKNPDKHPWKRCSKLKSIPCEFFKELLRKNFFVFEEEYSPLKDRNFSIDIAFPEYKIGLEINGDQHYEDRHSNVLKEYYKNRHSLLENEGWIILEVHYYNVFIEEEQNRIMDVLNDREKALLYVDRV